MQLELGGFQCLMFLQHHVFSFILKDIFVSLVGSLSLLWVFHLFCLICCTPSRPLEMDIKKI